MIYTFFLYLFTAIISSYIFSKHCLSKSNLQKRLIFTAALILPCLLAGLRYDVGTDYFTYLQAFEIIKLGGETRWEHVEFGFYLLNVILNKLNLPPESIFFVSSFITLFFIYNGISNNEIIKYSFLAPFIFYLMFFQASFNTIRIIMAVSIFFYNIRYIKERDFKKYFIFTMLASSIHLSAIVTLPVYFMYNFLVKSNRSLEKNLVYLLVAIIISSIGPVIEYVVNITGYQELSYYLKYTMLNESDNSLFFKKILMYAPIILVGYLKPNYHKDQKVNENLYFSLLIIGIIIDVFSSFNATYLNRLSYYFLVSIVAYIPIIFFKLHSIKEMIYKISIIHYILFYWIYTYFIIKNHDTVPYKWIL